MFPFNIQLGQLSCSSPRWYCSERDLPDHFVKYYSYTSPHAGGIKRVSRFNILFEGEDEDSLDAVKAVALQQQQHLALVGEQ